MSLRIPAVETDGAQGERLPKEQRIRKRADFLRIQQAGRRVHSPHFVIIVAPAERQRIGITVTKRVAKAVGRNRIKRLVREVYRRNRALMPAHSDVVVIARRGAERLDYGAVAREFSHAAPALMRAAHWATAEGEGTR